MALSKPTWLLPDRLASFNNDTIRAELGPRRIALRGEEGVAVTPEEALEIEKQVRAARAAGKVPETRLLLDRVGRFAPQAWKLYQKDADGRFQRAGTADTFEEALTGCTELAGEGA